MRPSKLPFLFTVPSNGGPSERTGSPSNRHRASREKKPFLILDAVRFTFHASGILSRQTGVLAIARRTRTPHRQPREIDLRRLSYPQPRAIPSCSSPHGSTSRFAPLPSLRSTRKPVAVRFWTSSPRDRGWNPNAPPLSFPLPLGDPLEGFRPWIRRIHVEPDREGGG